jgi:ribosomal protein S18 acetylase RimI-like enzyme
MDIWEITTHNFKDFPATCFTKAEHPGRISKLKWMQKQSKHGLRIFQAYREETSASNRCIGFVEYIEGAHAFRAVEAKDYLFIHCIWVSPNLEKNKGLGSLLVRKVVQDAQKSNKLGVAVITSTSSFMANGDLFKKNGFDEIEVRKPYSLFVKKFSAKSTNPKFKNTEKALKKYKGFHLLYTHQCPWIAQIIEPFQTIAKKNKLNLEVKELTTPSKIQNGPSIYGIFSLIYNGELLADHYISQKRFENIIKKLKR